ASRNEMLRSTDGGRSWSPAGMPGNGDQLAWLELVTHPSGDRVLAGTGRAVYVSQDGGKLWLQLGSGLPATPAKRVAADGGRVVAAMSTGGLFLSEDGGLSWDRVATTGDVRLFTGLAFTGQGDLIVASKEDGLYRVNLLGLSAEPPGPVAGASKK
ncbi:MAG: WD40/YVTN/BNR-like repeat-containing protein, partial [Dongiaceae bacterium]